MNRAFVGDCRDVLRELIAQGARAQMCVTSPPYWGVRDYGIAPSVWGGAAECDHQWGDNITMHRGGPHGNGVFLSGGRAVVAAQASTKKMRSGNFCMSCGAWLGCLGLEPNIFMYVEHIVEVFRLVKEVLKKDGTLWLNIGDTYNTTNKSVGVKLKEMCAIPWRVGIALSDDGWYLRQDNIWHKPNVMPSSQRDRCTSAHEYVLLLSKSRKYYFNEEAIKEPASPNTHARLARAHGGYAPPGQDGHRGILAPRANSHGVNPKACTPGQVLDTRKKRSVWTIPTLPYAGPHYATFPTTLVQPCVLAGSRPGDVVLDPFAGTGTVGEVCNELARKYILIDIDPKNEVLQHERTSAPQAVMAI